MKPAILTRGDVLGGLLLVAVGAVALWLTRNLPFGSLTRMGSGFGPRVMAIVVIAFGVAVIARGLVRGEPIALSRAMLRPALFVGAAIIAFALLIERAGLIPACLVTVPLAAFADRQARPLEVAMIALAAAAAASLIFVRLLRLNFPLWPT